MFLGGVMQTTGNRPPGTLPQKGKWMAADLQRWAKRFNTPYKPNPHFPMMTLMVQRAAQEWVDRPDFDKYLAAIFNAAWRDQKNIADKAVLAEVLTTAGFSPEEFFAAAENPANKEKLKATTDEAVARGVFGAPTFFVDADGEECTSARTGWISSRKRWRAPEPVTSAARLLHPRHSCQTRAGEEGGP